MCLQTAHRKHFFLNQGNTDLHQIHWVQVDQWGSFLTVQPGAAEQLTTFLLRKAAPFLVYHFIFGYSTVYQSRRLHKSAQPKAMFFFPTCKMPPSCCVLRVKAVSCVYQFVLQSEQNSQVSCVFNTMPLNCHTHTQKKLELFNEAAVPTREPCSSICCRCSKVFTSSKPTNSSNTASRTAKWSHCGNAE